MAGIHYIRGSQRESESVNGFIEFSFMGTVGTRWFACTIYIPKITKVEYISHKFPKLKL